jgi:hypothetical protein
MLVLCALQETSISFTWTPIKPDTQIARPAALRQVAAQQRTDRSQAAGDGEENGERPPARLDRERIDHECERGRIENRSARALQDAEGDQPGLREAPVRRQSAKCRRPRETGRRQWSLRAGRR